MNSLNDLNNYTETVEFTDTRPPAVFFDRTVPSPQTQNFLEGQSFTAAVGINIIEIINYDVAQVSYTVNVSAVAGATVSWTSIPSGLIVTNPSSGVYTISGIRDATDWLAVRSPDINTGDYFGTFQYTGTINYLSNQSKTWTTTATLTEVTEWNIDTVSDFWYTTAIQQTITPTPRLVDTTSPVAVMRVTVTPTRTDLVSAISSAGSGGTTNFNSITKVFTIDGTNTQINSHLAALRFTSVAGAAEHLTFTYRAISLLFGSIDARTQNIKSQTIRFMSLLRNNLVTYAEDDPEFSIGSTTPLITNEEYVGSGTFTVTVTSTAAQTLATTSALGGTSTWNGTTLTLSGLRPQVNDRLNSLTLKVKPDFTANTTINYNLTSSPQGGTASRTQTITNTAQHEEISSNITNTRVYQQGVTAFLWATDTPQITDLDTSGTYTITLASTLGQFSASGTTTSANWTYTGSKIQVNALLPLIQFIPNSASVDNETITYTQRKGGVTQATRTFLLEGPGIRFDNVNPQGTQINIAEGDTHQLPVVTNPTFFNTGQSLTFRIDVSLSSGAKVEWVTIPAGCVLTNPTAGVYLISNVTTVAQWNVIRNPNITLSNAYNGTFSYTVAIQWKNGQNSLTWTNNVSVIDIYPLTTPGNNNYYSGSTQTITAYPMIVDNGNQILTWTAIVSPSQINNISTMSSSATGGTSSFNSTDKTLTIIGTQTEVNLHLSNISLISNPSSTTDFNLSYFVSNNLNSETGDELQIFTKLPDYVFSKPNSTIAQASSTSSFAISTESNNITQVNSFAAFELKPVYTISISAISSKSSAVKGEVTWTNIPSGCIVTNPSPNVYKISGISSTSDWQAIKNPIIKLTKQVNGQDDPVGFVGPESVVITSTVNNSLITDSWTSTITLSDVPELSPLQFYRFYTPVSTSSYFDAFQFSDSGSEISIRKVEVAINGGGSSAVSTAGIYGGTSVWDGQTRILTVTGTKQQVNSHLMSLYMNTALRNSTISFEGTAYGEFNQTHKAYLTYFGNGGTNILFYPVGYNEENIPIFPGDKFFSRWGANFNLISSNTFNFGDTPTGNTAMYLNNVTPQSGNYTVEITGAPADVTMELNLTNIGQQSVPTWDWNNAGKKLTMTGTYIAINNMFFGQLLGTSRIQGTRSGTELTSFELTITVTAPDGQVVIVDSLVVGYR
jgi:hypothetical protein